MKKLLVLFSALAITFAGIWIYKMKTPGSRPDSFANGLTANYWWNSMSEAEAEVDTAWRLSDGVPRNYIPVPGKAGLYMVVDEDGYIIGYKRQVKSDSSDGYTWEDVNPDIPENYEAVPNLKDVYKVTYDDGSVKYFKYIRNKDDTYAFVEVDAKGNMFGISNPEGSEIPENYERVNKNQFAVKNENGVTIAFKERVVDPTAEGGFKWEDIEEDDVISKTAIALSDTGFNLDTDITGIGDGTGGNRPYFENISGGNTEITYAIPTLMPQQDVTASSNSGTFVFMQPTQETIITEQVYVTAPPLNIPEGGQVQIVGGNGQTQVITGADGSTYVIKPIGTVTGSNGTQGESEFINNMRDGVQTGDLSSGDNGIPSMPTVAPSVGDLSGYTQTTGSSSMGIDQTVTGNKISRETVNTKVQEGNDMVTYQEVVETVYDASGNEIQKRSLGKTEVSRTPISGTGGSQSVASNLNDEYSRIYNQLSSNGGSFDSGVPARLRELINNARIENGKQPLLAPGSNDSIYKIALSRAAMMAITGSSSKDLPNYGSLKSMCSTYGVSVNLASENMLITSDASAESINAMLSGSINDIVTSDGYTHVAIAVVKMGGRIFVCEIFY